MTSIGFAGGWTAGFLIGSVEFHPRPGPGRARHL